MLLQLLPNWVHVGRCHVTESNIYSLYIKTERLSYTETCWTVKKSICHWSIFVHSANCIKWWNCDYTIYCRCYNSATNCTCLWHAELRNSKKLAKEWKINDSMATTVHIQICLMLQISVKATKTLTVCALRLFNKPASTVTLTPC
jgi:hypothetical protein